MSIHDKKPIQLTHYTERIWRLEAAANHRDILFSTDLGGNEQEQLFLLKAGETEAVDLCQDGTTRFNLGGTNAQSDTVYFTCNRRSKANFDICKMNMQTREIVTVLESRDNMNMPASVSPDGRYMLINKLKGMSNLGPSWKIPLPTAVPTGRGSTAPGKSIGMCSVKCLPFMWRTGSPRR